jgi:hypothetical protein
MQLKNVKTGLLATVFLIGSLPFGNALADGVTTGVDSRSRGEYTEMGNIQANPANGNYRANSRTRVSVDGKAGDVSASVSVQEDRDWSNSSDLGVYEGWVQWGWGDLTFRAGRQEYSMDEGRLMGNDDWNNGRTYDGLAVGYASGDYKLNMFATRGEGYDLFVLNPSTSISGIDISIPIMYGTNAIGGADMDATSMTAGLYAKSGGDLSWRLEGYFQQHSMTMDGADAVTSSGMLVSLALGYKVSDNMTPTLNVDYTAAAGEEAHVFGTGMGNTHQYNGASDIVAAGPGGLIDVGLSNDFGEMGPGSLSFGFHYLMLADAEAVEGVDGTGVGMEIDLDYTIKISDALSLTISEHLFIDQSDAAADKDVTMHDLTLVQLSLSM